MFKKGKTVKAILLKNNLIAFIIQAPIWVFFEKEEIDSKLFYSGLKYSKDYFLSAVDNMAKQRYDGTGIGANSFKAPNKEPSQASIDADKRINQIKDRLKINEKKIVEFFFEQEKDFATTMIKFNITRYHLKKVLIQILETMREYYEKN